MKAKVKRIAKREVSERERVLYNFDAKKFIILCSTTFNKHTLSISKSQIVDLTHLLNDRSQFYAYCNKTLKLLHVLHCDAYAQKKEHSCINTQYDSRKKLMSIVEHIALSILKMKAISKKEIKKHTKVKA